MRPSAKTSAKFSKSCHCEGAARFGFSASAWFFPAVLITSQNGTPSSSTTARTVAMGCRMPVADRPRRIRVAVALTARPLACEGIG